MITVVIMCQQGIPFDLSPARTQIIDELSVRGTRVIVFFPGIVNEKKIRTKASSIINTKRMDNLSIRRKIKSIDPDVVICTTIEDVKSCF